MPKKVIWSPQSEIDLLQITDYLNENWEGKVVIKFIDIIALLSTKKVDD